MGSESSKVHVKASPMPSNHDLQLLKDQTHFSVEEIKTLWERFDFLTKTQDTKGIINLEEFKNALGMQSAAYTHRIFVAFDVNKNAEIEFSEFVLGLSAICPRASIKEKSHFVFNMFDLNGDGIIDKQELKQLMDISLGTNSLIQLPESHIEKIIDLTFTKMDKNNDGMITLEDFQAEAETDPSVL